MTLLLTILQLKDYLYFIGKGIITDENYNPLVLVTFDNVSDKYDFDSIFRIYEKINITFKKVGNLSMFSKEKTRIDIMSNISYEIVTKLINTKSK